MTRPRFDVTFEPEGLATVATKTPARPIRFYESSIPGHVSIVLDDGSGLPVGTRLDAAQVADLIDGLFAWRYPEEAPA